MATVSIVTPTYNHSAYIADCIASVLDQTFADWEMIVVDDGSTDGTGEVVKSFGDARVHYHYQPHHGIGGLHALYNNALQRSSGEFIAILEGDDIWPNDRLTILLDAIKEPQVVLSYGVTQLVDKQGSSLDGTIPTALHLKQHVRIFSNQPIGFAVKEMLMCNSLWTGSVSSLIRRSALETIGGFQTVPGGCLIDRPTFFSLGLIGEFRFVPQITGFWRQHGDSSTKSRVLWSMIATGLSLYVEEFVHHYHARLLLSNADAETIVGYWKNACIGARLACGRSHLVTRAYNSARDEFRFCLLSGKPRYALPALLGYVASLLHVDIEWIYRSMGLNSIRAR
jgi:glycosyltransferase involved in cell wall biosynthesis